MLTEYQTKSNLNPAIWKGDRLRSKLHKAFMRIAEKFIEFLEIDTQIYDIILIGSNANYNWTKSSDIDIHVVINYMEVGDNMHLVKNYMMAKKSLWNQKYPLKYRGMDIELFAQDVNQELHTSVGEYSILHNKWIRKPTADLISIDDDLIEQKAAPLEYEIDALKETDPKLREKIADILARLYKMRQTGLEAEGEYSLENLAFKRLRTSGHLARLKDMLDTRTMSHLQIESVLNELNIADTYNKAKGKVRNFVNALKTEKDETKQAMIMLLQHIEGKKLSPEEWKWIREQMKDVVKLLGLTTMAVVPGGSLIAILTKALKLDKHVMPSAFKKSDETEITESLVMHMKGQSLSNSDWANIIRKTGAVVDPRGQWDHPGKCTMIPTTNGQITMQNVPHQVFGIDDTGHSIMMEPEQHYQFPGKRVFEIPNTAQWKTMIIQLQNAIQNGTRYAK